MSPPKKRDRDNMTLSVIIPVYNGAKTICRCAAAVVNAHPFEIIVVDDGSTDDTPRLVKSSPVALLTTAGPGGPAQARNAGAAQAKGDVLVFVDADVEVHEGSLARIANLFLTNPDLHAVFGSYDDEPEYRSAVSLYKNLLHHYVHQQGQGHASTFWAGLGAVRRTTYLRLGGLDESYRRPSIEDIEFGYRLRESGLRCELHREIQGKHLKHWTFVQLIKTDLFDRAVPWTELILRTGRCASDLNFGWRHKANSLVALAIPPVLSIAGAGPILFLIPILAAVFIVANFSLLRFLKSRGGLLFLFCAIPLHLLYGLSCAVGFMAGMTRYTVRVIFRKEPIQNGAIP